MPDNALETYLNDHLGGATLGTDLAKQIRDRSQGTPLGDRMDRIAAEIDEDHDTLVRLMDELGADKNPVKQASAWLAEKASRLKFGAGDEADYGLFMALETLRLGVEGKLSLWLALQPVADRHPPLAAADLDGLIARAQSQRDQLEEERVKLGAQVFAS